MLCLVCLVFGFFLLILHQVLEEMWGTQLNAITCTFSFLEKVLDFVATVSLC